MAWPHKLFSGRVSDLDLRLLRIFRVVVECGGFTAAERELGIGRSAISKRIGDLEHRVGARLCERGRSGFSLTDEGRAVHEATVDLLAAIDRFQAQVNTVDPEAAGHLHIGLIDTLVSSGDSKLVKAMRAFHDGQPRVSISLMIATEGEIRHAVQDRRIDLGIVPVDPESVGDGHLLFRETGFLYCGNQHPAFEADLPHLPLDALRSLPMVQHAYSVAESRLIKEFGLSPAASTQQTEGVLLLVLTGRYIGFLPDHYARFWERQGRLRAIRPDAVRKVTDIIAFTRRGSPPHPIVRRFLSALA